jgi:hypothetical protein
MSDIMLPKATIRFFNAEGDEVDQMQKIQKTNRSGANKKGLR